jgi:hypothetical protein
MITYSPVSITKASGEKQRYDESKLVKSLSSSGLSIDVAAQTVDYIKHNVKSGITTKDIHDQIATFLKKNAPVEDYFNYGLKRAIMDLGPSGHPFEIIVSDLLIASGYKTEVGVIVLGKCVTHEVDVVAEKDGKKYFIECKFHNTAGVKTDIQVGLYTYARFLDIKTAMETNHGTATQFHPWLITNTKVTSEVSDYAACVDMHLTTWLTPKNHGIHEMIIAAGLHPITLLYKLPRHKIHTLIDMGIVSCARLMKAIREDTVPDIFTLDEQRDILEDVSKVCKNNK